MTHLPEIVSWLDANPEAAAAAPRHVAIVVRGVRQGRLRAMGLEILRRELPGIDGKATGIDAGARSRSTHDPGKAIGRSAKRQPVNPSNGIDHWASPATNGEPQ